MTSGGLREMLEGDSADICAGKISAIVDGGPSGGSHVHRHGIEALAEIIIFINQ